MFARLFAFSALMALLAAACLAQVTGRLTGSVTDTSGAAMPNVTVELRLKGSSKAALSTVTTAEGLFTFTGIRPESYDVVVLAQGFLNYTLRGVKIDPARETSLPPIKLELAAVTQAVDVTADVQTVQTSHAEISTTVTNAQVRRLHRCSTATRWRSSVTQARVSQGADATNGGGDIVINGARVRPTTT